MASLFVLSDGNPFASFRGLALCRITAQNELDKRHRNGPVRVRALVIEAGVKTKRVADVSTVNITSDMLLLQDAIPIDFVYVILYKPPEWFIGSDVKPSQVEEWGYVHVNWLHHILDRWKDQGVLYKDQCIAELPGRPFFPSYFRPYPDRPLQELVTLNIDPLLMQEALETRMVFFTCLQTHNMCLVPDMYRDCLYLQTQRGVLVDALGFYIAAFVATRPAVPGIRDHDEFVRMWQMYEERLFHYRLRALGNPPRAHHRVHFPVFTRTLEEVKKRIPEHVIKVFIRADEDRWKEKDERTYDDKETRLELWRLRENNRMKWTFAIAGDFTWCGRALNYRQVYLFKGTAVFLANEFLMEAHMYAWKQDMDRIFMMFRSHAPLTTRVPWYREALQLGNMFRPGGCMNLMTSSPMQQLALVLPSGISTLDKYAPPCVKRMMSMMRRGTPKWHLTYPQRNVAFTVLLTVGLPVRDIEDLVHAGAKHIYPTAQSEIKGILGDLRWRAKKNPTYRHRCQQIREVNLCPYKTSEPCAKELGRRLQRNVKALYNPHFFIAQSAHSPTPPQTEQSSLGAKRKHIEIEA